MDPLKFLNIENPQIQQARFSGLAGQKASLMEKYLPKKTSVGAAAAQGAIGGAMAGGQLMANMGAFNGETPSATETAGSEAYGNRTAPTIEEPPAPSQQGAAPTIQPPRSQMESMLFLLGNHYR